MQGRLATGVAVHQPVDRRQRHDLVTHPVGKIDDQPGRQHALHGSIPFTEQGAATSRAIDAEAADRQRPARRLVGVDDRSAELDVALAGSKGRGVPSRKRSMTLSGRIPITDS